MKSCDLLNFEIPLNIREFDSYFNNIVLLNKESSRIKVNTIYGSFPNSYFGSGRPYTALGKISKKEFENIVRLIQTFGFSFNYCLNAPSFEGEEGNFKFQKKLCSFLDYLMSIDVRKITISNPYLIYFIGRYYPNFEITISSFMQINSIFGAEIFSNFNNVKYIVLPQRENKNLNLIKNLCTFLGKLGKYLIIILDLNCAIDCPIFWYHSLVTGYFKKGKKLNELWDFIEIFCDLEKNKRNFESSLIEPEKIVDYLNIGCLNYKIQGRQLSSNLLISNIKRYFDFFNVYENIR